MKPQRLDSRITRKKYSSRIAALLFGAAIFVCGCENDIEKVKAFGSQGTFPILEAKTFETMFTDSGTVRYHLKAPKLLQFENEGNEFLEFPEGMELVQFNANKKVISSMVADYAKQFVKEQKWEAKNNVVATNSKGDTLKTDHLIWEEKTQKVYTEEAVEIIQPDAIWTGLGLTADESLANWKIKRLTGVVYITMEDNKPATKNNNQEETDKKNKKPFDGPLQFEK
jgi:LPS export ABC transporter protein LptC